MSISTSLGVSSTVSPLPTLLRNTHMSIGTPSSRSHTTSTCAVRRNGIRLPSGSMLRWWMETSSRVTKKEGAGVPLLVASGSRVPDDANDDDERAAFRTRRHNAWRCAVVDAVTGDEHGNAKEDDAKDDDDEGDGEGDGDDATGELAYDLERCIAGDCEGVASAELNERARAVAGMRTGIRRTRPTNSSGRRVLDKRSKA